jgi:pyridoxamine 5'-phosphate oxidase
MNHMKKDLSDFRKEYRLMALNEADLPAAPLLLFNKWLEQAISGGLPEPNAMTLATVDSDCKPSARVVLLKEVSGGGFVFYTNYLSDKGRELAHNPNASLVFLWLEMQRQVRISGRVEKVSAEESDAYFGVRPRNSQAGAVASMQSTVIQGREELEARFEEVYNQEGDIRRPLHWGGYRLMPELIEFWQGRESRLHDRLRYRKLAEGWKLERLAP